MSSADTISIDTIIHASIEDVWNAWTEPQIVLKWFGSDPKGKGIKAAMDVRPGGSFEISFADSNGTGHTCFGFYKEVEKHNHLSFTWSWKNEPGVESFVTIFFIAANDNTQMQFQHANLGTASKHNYIAGWQTTFEKLDRIMTSDNGDHQEK
jgi:uncharacterized protein YndB with AHSA1/START domain